MTASLRGPRAPADDRQKAAREWVLRNESGALGMARFLEIPHEFPA